MIERSFWHPVMALDALAAAPVAAQLLGEAVVLWRDGDGVVHAWHDQCPHRGARLSLGRVVAGRLACGYHGWQFATDGRCVEVPAQPNWVPPPTHCARRFGCVESSGLIWVQLEPDAAAPQPGWGWVADASLQHSLAGPYVLAASAPRVVENFLDMTHFGFIHDGWLGSESHTELAAYQVVESDLGLTVPSSSVWQPQAFASGEGGQVSYAYEVRSPYGATLTKLGGAQVHHIALAICPQSSDVSTVWFRMANTDMGLAESQIVAFQDEIFRQDRVIIESQTPKLLPLTTGELHGPLDRVSAAYRRYLSRLGVKTGVTA